MAAVLEELPQPHAYGMMHLPTLLHDGVRRPKQLCYGGKSQRKML
jgi:hypothetical protein